MSISSRIRNVNNRIGDAALNVDRLPGDIQLVAVTKQRPIEAIWDTVETGQYDLGENRTRELKDKAKAIGESPLASLVRWHMIGHLQTNKVKEIIEVVHVVHSLDRASLAKEICKRASAIGRVIDCLLQVNISGEEQKYGLDPSNLADFVSLVSELPGVNPIGLMGMASNTSETSIVRSQFSNLRELRDRVCPGLAQLSMGMSNDFEIAIEEGATMVRVGSELYSA